MKKEEIIKKINEIIDNYGSFSIGEVQYETSPCVDEMGSLVALAEGFHKDYAEIEIYNPSGFSSDSLESYDMQYSDMSIELLEEILSISENYAVDMDKTYKRCND